VKLKLLTAANLLALVVVGCAPGATTPALTGTRPAAAEVVTLNVFAAASLTEPFEELGAQFATAHPGVTVAFSFGGSQQLAQQINEGAPADVFASANSRQLEVVIAAGGIVSGTQQTFARNRLVVVYPADNPAGLVGLGDLARPGLKLVFAAPEVPMGQYTLEFLEKAAVQPGFGAGYREAVLANVVSYEDNVRAVLTKVALGEADGGIVYTSDVSGSEAGEVGRLEIPDALNVIASYPIAPIAGSPHAELARAFIDLVLSAEGQAVLAKYGFVAGGD
jgi:molybdate transport system substrate-binding protein